LNRAAATLLDRAKPFGKRIAAYLDRAKQHEPRRDGVEMALVCADALGRLTWLHAARMAPLQSEQVAALETTRLAALSYVAAHVAMLDQASTRKPVASLLLPVSVDGGRVRLHPATIAAVNTLRMESFAELYDAAGDLDTLDRSLAHEADSLAGWSGLSVRFPRKEVGSQGEKRRALGGKWRCTLEPPAEMASPAKKRKACVKLTLTTQQQQQQQQQGGVACSLSVRPAPYHFEMLYTCSVLKGNAPRVRFTQPNVPLSNPLVHAQSGLVSPLALEHLELVVTKGSSAIPTAATVVELVELLINGTPLGTLVAACAINEEACWKACE